MARRERKDITGSAIDVLTSKIYEESILAIREFISNSMPSLSRMEQIQFIVNMDRLQIIAPTM
jgi:hypothetical protein